MVAAQKKYRDAEQVKVAVNQWIAGLPLGTTLEPIGAIELRHDDVEAVRKALTDAKRELQRIEKAPIPSPNLAHHISAYVDELAMKARPIVSGIAEGQRITVLWPVRLENTNRANQSGFSADLCHPLLMMALLQRDTLISAITAETERLVTAVAPLSDRPARISELRTEIERLEREEEVLCEQAGVPRRADADPAAVLSVKIMTTEAVAA